MKIDFMAPSLGSNQRMFVHSTKNVQTRSTVASVESLKCDAAVVARVLKGVNRESADLTLQKDKLSSMSEMSEMTSLRLQMVMDRLSKLMSTLSNLLKKMSQTQNGITSNLK